MKSVIMKEKLVSVAESHTDYIECVLCGGYGPIEAEIHEANCVFYDPEVDRIVIEGKQRCGDPAICGKCAVGYNDCPATFLSGWALTLHKQLIRVCKRYKDELEKK